jgi:hypothetical protein
LKGFLVWIDNACERHRFAAAAQINRIGFSALKSCNSDALTRSNLDALNEAPYAPYACAILSLGFAAKL